MRPDTTRVNPRQTFLRWHLLGGAPSLEQGADPNGSLLKNPGELFRTNELLGLDYLIGQLSEAGEQDSDDTIDAFQRRQRAQKLLTPQAFFYGLPGDEANYTDLRLYIPVPVRVLEPARQQRDPRDRRDRYAELTELLRDLDDHHEDNGVLLLGQSGGGKTVATKKAANDCLFRDVWLETLRERHQTRDEFLSLPEEPGTDSAADSEIEDSRASSVSVRRSESLSGDRLPSEKPAPQLAGFLPCRILGDMDQLPEEDTLEHLLIAAAGIKHTVNNVACVREYLRWTKLLVLCDLNAVPPKNREKVVGALRSLHQRVKDGKAENYPWHRVLITYRSSQQDDGLLVRLLADDLFHQYELQSLNTAQAVAYIGNLREVERVSCKRLGLAPPVRDVKAEQQLLRDLDKRIVRDEKSMISIPLMMHFVSIISGDRLATVNTIADLYDCVVDETLARNRRLYPKKMPDLLLGSEGNAIVRALMTRIALSILGQGPDAVLMGVDYCRRLLGRPDQYAQQEPLWPQPDRTSEAWWESPDSLCYTNTGPLPARNWPRDLLNAVIEFSLLRRNGDQIGFLHDSFLYYYAGAHGLWDRGILDLEPGPGTDSDTWYDAVAARVEKGCETWNLPIEFLSARLNVRQCRELVERLVVAEPQRGLAQLLLTLIRPFSCTPDNLTRTSIKTSRGVAAKPSEFESLDREILRVIDHALRRLGALFHDEPQQLMHVCFHDLQWCSCSSDLNVSLRQFADNYVRKRLLATCRPWLECKFGGYVQQSLTMSEHTGSVLGVAPMPDGRVASCSADGTVRVWDVLSGLVRTVVEHDACVNALVVTRDGTIASASDDGTVKVWNPLTGQVHILELHTRSVICLAEYADGVFVSGDISGNVVHWDWRTGNAITLLTHGRQIVCIAVSPDGRIASGSTDRTVSLWTPSTRIADTIITHDHTVTCVAFLPDGTVVSGSRVGTVRIWNPSYGDSLGNWKGLRGSFKMWSMHPGAVWAIAVLSDGDFVTGSTHDDTYLDEPWFRDYLDLPHVFVVEPPDGEVIFVDEEVATYYLKRWSRWDPKALTYHTSP